MSEEKRALPDGWRWVKLGDVCEKNTGFRDPRSEPTTIFRYVDISSVSNLSKTIVEARTILGKDAPSRARQVIRVNDVIVSTTRPNLNAVAKVPIELDNQICSTGFCVLRPERTLCADYLFSFVQHPMFIKSLSDLVKGALYPAVTDEQVKKQIIPLPPLSEQQRIATILRAQMAAVDQARAAAQARLEAARALPEAFLRGVFPNLQQPLPTGWRWVPFGQITSNHDGKRIPVKQDHRKIGEFPYYGASGIIDYVSEYLFNGDYLLVAEDGANLIARSTPIAFRASGKFWVNNHAHVVQAESSTLLDYLVHYFQIADISKYVKGAAQPKLNQNDLNVIPIPYPPVEEQRKTVELLHKQLSVAEKVKTTLETELATINTLPAALLRRAFNGEL